jgi:glycosyltransferase involved in cell wall biosynthesis
MPTYNHAPYIGQALEGCLAQEADFPFEIVVCDDCSTDGTTEIVREYARKYPNIIPSLQKSNTGSHKNFIDGLNKIRGVYVAFCEGDDFWKASCKLQKQVRFLRENPDFSICCHKVEMLVMDPAQGKKHPGEKQYIYKDLSLENERIRNGVFYADEAIANYYFQTSSMVFRWRFTQGLPNWFRHSMLWDHFLFMLHAVEGKIKYFDEDMSVWRRHGGGYTYLQTLNKGLFFQQKITEWIEVYEEMDRFFSYRFTLQIRERILLALRNTVENCLQINQIDKIRHIIAVYRKYFTNPVLENAVLLDAMRLAMPEEREFCPPWSSPLSSSVNSLSISLGSAGGQRDCARTEEACSRAVGGFFEPALADIPEVEGSVWNIWTQNSEYACFADANQAFYSWLWHNNCRDVWLPAFAPPFLFSLMPDVQFITHVYTCGATLNPNPDFLDKVLPGHAVLTFSYFGKPVFPELEKALLVRPDILWVEDRRHSLWPGQASKARAAIYSPGEVLGVPDGAVLVGGDVQRLQPATPACSSEAFFEQMRLSLQRLEDPHIDNRHILEHSRLESLRQLPAASCSRMTQELLKRIPLAPPAAKRRANWKYLMRKLKPYALWPEDEVNFAPYAFPVLVSDDKPGAVPVEVLSTILAAKNIFCRRCWFPLFHAHAFAMENSLSKNMLLLPCDQRYGEKEMERLAEEIVAYCTGNFDEKAISADWGKRIKNR